MAFCTNCGAQTNGKFCTACGAVVGSGAPAGQPAESPAPVPPAAPPAPKKRGFLFYGLIGCGGLIVVGILALVAGGMFIAHKAKQAGLDPDLAKRNPAYAAAMFAVAANPGVELVNSDEGRGTLTIREKKTGKTVTLNFEDIKRGHIVFESDNGERVDFRGEGAGANLPSWVPAYPGATVQGGISGAKEGEQGGTATLKTSDSQEKVADFYERAFKDAGMTVERQPAGGAVTVVAKDEGAQRSATALISADGGQTNVMLTFGAKQ